VRLRSLAALAATAAAVSLVVSCTSSNGKATPTPSTSPSAVVSGDASAAADPSGPRYPQTDVPSADGQVVTVPGDNWSMPAWVRPPVNSGFFSEASDTSAGVDVHSVDLSWRQLAPTPRGPLDTTSRGSAQDMGFLSLTDQLARPGDFWLRVFASGTDWAPRWIPRVCHVQPVGKDYDGQTHLPIWNPCVWHALMRTYRQLFVGEGLRADPRLRFVYVPGAFTWVEYDYDIINQAVHHGLLTKRHYLRWYDHMVNDLVRLFGPYRNKLVFTGEDYPWGPFGRADDLLAAKAVAAGMGIRTGIPEESNFHLSEAPSYASRIARNGHLLVDDDAPIHDGTRVVATENECFNDCGYHTNDPYYAVVQTNLKSLQLRTNWIYVVPGPSYMYDYPQHWDWVRLELGQQRATTPDAWAELRNAEDTFWNWPDWPFTPNGRAWPSRPWVRNLERWVTQVDVPGGVAHRSDADVHRHTLTRENGVAYEGLRTDLASNQSGLYFRLDPTFAQSLSGDVLVRVTWLDDTGASWTFASSGDPVPVAGSGRGKWVTSTIRVPAAAFAAGLTGGTDFAVQATGGSDVTVRFVRVVRLDAP
jgi:hypothetical protein